MITRNNEGEFVFSVDETSEFEDALKEVLATTEIGRQYRKDYFTKERGDEDAGKLVDAAVEVAKDTTGQPLISRPILERALTLLIDSGKIRPKTLQTVQQLEEPEEDLRPRDKNGKLLTQSQLDWSEMTTFAQTATPDAIRQRKYVDGKFREFIQTNLRREMQETPIDGAVTPAGEPDKKTKATPELVDFVHRYNRTSSDAIKPRGGYVRLVDSPPMLYSTFVQLVERAAQARLL